MGFPWGIQVARSYLTTDLAVVYIYRNISCLGIAQFFHKDSSFEDTERKEGAAEFDYLGKLQFH